jgi:hypothetical protein
VIFGQEFQHGGAVILEQHFFPMADDRMVTDPQSSADLFAAQSIPDELKNFRAPSRQFKHVRSLPGFRIKHLQQFKIAVQARTFADVCEMPLNSVFLDGKHFGNAF